MIRLVELQRERKTNSREGTLADLEKARGKGAKKVAQVDHKAM